jgi:hypothetical protein
LPLNHNIYIINHEVFILLACEREKKETVLLAKERSESHSIHKRVRKLLQVQKGGEMILTTAAEEKNGVMATESNNSIRRTGPTKKKSGLNTNLKRYDGRNFLKRYLK